VATVIALTADERIPSGCEHPLVNATHRSTGPLAAGAVGSVTCRHSSHHDPKRRTQMTPSRRDLACLLPAFVAAVGRPASAQIAAREKLDTKMYHHGRVPYVGNDQKKGRRFFMGETHGGFNLETHETILGVGVETHAPHKHLHEEIIIVVEGTVETYNEGVTETLEAGSVIFYGSNQVHSARNVGTVPARYYVIELRGEE
jgi:quercetin dioxygenase-like cupin family protein